MLKIKDDVDMSILKNYGFQVKDGINEKYYKDYEKQGFYICEIDEEYPKNERIIKSDYCKGCDNYTDEDLDVIYDLIKDGIIEKVK